MDTLQVAAKPVKSERELKRIAREKAEYNKARIESAKLRLATLEQKMYRTHNAIWKLRTQIKRWEKVAD